MPDRLLVVPHPKPAARLKLVCFHHAGGGVSAYRSWVRRLQSDVELILVQLPGREERLREPPFTMVDDVLTALVLGLKPRITTGNYAIFGHSLGAMLAYTLVARCVQTNELPVPKHLFISGAPSPEPSSGSSDLYRMQDDDSLLNHIRKLGGTPELLLSTPDIRDAILTALRADAQLCAELGNMCAPPINVPMTILRGVDDPIMSLKEAEAWRARSTKAVHNLSFPGGHFFVQTSQSAVLAEIDRVLSTITLD